MSFHAVSVRGTSGTMISLTKSECVRAWAKQSGAHEDWGYTQGWASIVSFDFRINGMRLHTLELKTTADAVRSSASQFFRHYNGC